MSSIELASAGRPAGRGRRRIGFRLDMTPLVDVAFLLLTFFMFATTMSQPQVMEIAVPPANGDVGVPASRLLTLLVRDDGALFYRLGTATPVATTLEGIAGVVGGQVHLLGNAQVTALRADPRASYGAVVAILDRLDAVEARVADELVARGEKRLRRFTIAPMDDASRRAIAGR